MNSIRPTHLNHFLLKHYKCLRPLQDAQFMGAETLQVGKVHRGGLWKT